MLKIKSKILLVLLLVIPSIKAVIQSVLIYKKEDRHIIVIGDLNAFAFYHLSEAEALLTSTRSSLDKEDKNIFIQWLKNITAANYKFNFYILSNLEEIAHHNKMLRAFRTKCYVPLFHDLMLLSQTFCKVDPTLNYKFILGDLRGGALARLNEFLGHIILFGQSNIFLNIYSKVGCNETFKNYIDRFKCVKKQVDELVSKLPIEEQLAFSLALSVIEEDFDKLVTVLQETFKAYKFDESYVKLFSNISNTKDGMKLIKQFYQDSPDSPLAILGILTQLMLNSNSNSNNILVIEATQLMSNCRLIEMAGYELVYKAGFYIEKERSKPGAGPSLKILEAHKFTQKELTAALSDVTKIISAGRAPGGNPVEPECGAPRSKQESHSAEKKVHESRCFNGDCNKEGSLQCARCKVARYCSQECQKAHWKSGHKKECGKK